MTKSEVPIITPCTRTWESMSGSSTERFCEDCQKHVHHLSNMTRREAEKTLAGRDGELCVVYRHDEAGELEFTPRVTPPKAPRAQLRGVRKMLAVPALLAALAATPVVACGGIPAPPGGMYYQPMSKAEMGPAQTIYTQEQAAAERLKKYGLTLDEEVLE